MANPHSSLSCRALRSHRASTNLIHHVIALSRRVAGAVCVAYSRDEEIPISSSMNSLVGPRKLEKKESNRNVQQPDSSTNSWNWIVRVFIVIPILLLVGYLWSDRYNSSSAGPDETEHSNNDSSDDFSVPFIDSVELPSPKNPNAVLSLCSSDNGVGKLSALQLWIRHSVQVHKASRLDDDVDYLRHDFTTQLLALITPRLEYSTKTLTKDWNLVSHLLRKADKRYRYLLQRKQDEGNQSVEDNESWSENMGDVPPPLRITVMGGSVTLGIQCKTGIPGHLYHDSTTKYCAWPHRLESFINEFFGVGQLVEVRNEAVGATNTGVGNTILEYDVIPGILEHSDILINSYSTNDAGHAAGNSTKFFSTMQEFCRLVLDPPRHQGEDFCQSSELRSPNHSVIRPLLIHIDDVLPPYYTPIHKYFSIPRLVSTLASHYSFLSLSYADMVRDYVYGDPKETWFSANEFPKGAYHYDIHPGQAMHISMAWMVAYTLLKQATAFCTYENEFWILQSLREVPQQRGEVDETNNEKMATMEPNVLYGLSAYYSLPMYDDSALKQSIPLQGQGPDIMNEGIEPRLPQPSGLLPSIDTKVTLSGVHSSWSDKSSQLQGAQAQSCSPSRTGMNDRFRNRGTEDTCPFSWVTGHDQSKNSSWVEANVVSRMTKSSSWVLETHYTFRKMGLTPPMGQVGATMNLEFGLSVGENPIRTVVVFYLRSYGKNWEKSAARIEVLASKLASSEEQWQLLAEGELAGYHDKTTSEMYAEVFSLENLSGPASENEAAERTTEQSIVTYQVRATLVDGQTFKIMGLALCQF